MLNTNLNIKRILLPVDFPNPSLPVVQQAATLARHFHAEIVMLHVATDGSHAAGVPQSGSGPANWDMVAEIVKAADTSLSHSLGPEIKSLAIQPVLAEGDPFQAIVETAQTRNADLIMMPSRGYTFDHFLLGSLTEEVLSGTECPVWTSARAEESSSLSAAQEFAIRNVLCAVDFGARSRKAVAWAAQMAAEFDAHLTLAHVTYDVGIWAPGGTYVNPALKAQLVDNASTQIADLQRDLGTKANVFIGSGAVPEVLRQAAKQTKADLLVTGCYPYGINLRTHGFATICAVPVPVVNV